MSNIPEVIADRIGPLVEPLHAAFEMARYRLDNDYPGLCRDNQTWLRSHVLRGLVYQQLVDDPLPGQWIVTGNHRQNGKIVLTFGSGEMALRFMHAFPAGRAPLAGPNRARRAYYTQQALADLSDVNNIPTQRLILVWQEVPGVDTFDITVLRPLGPGSIRRQVRSDLEVPLARTLTIFEQTQFDTADDVEELFFDFHEDDLGTGTDDDQ